MNDEPLSRLVHSTQQRKDVSGTSIIHHYSRHILPLLPHYQPLEQLNAFSISSRVFSRSGSQNFQRIFGLFPHSVKYELIS